MWNWYLQHRQRLEQFHPLLYERVIAAVIPSAGVAAPSEIRSFFQDYIQQRPQVRDVVGLALEKLEINLIFRERNDR